MISRLSVCLAIVFVCSATIPALAQNAALVGTVRDAQQALIPGVMVTLQNLDTSVEFTVSAAVYTNLAGFDVSLSVPVDPGIPKRIV